MREFIGAATVAVLCLGGAAPSPNVPSGVWPRERLGREPSVERGKWGTKWSNDYGHAVEQMALTPEELAKIVGRIVEGHPRLLLRPKSWEGGLSVAEFRARVKREPWSKGFERMAAKVKQEAGKAIDAKKPIHRGYAVQAALYYLATGDESVIPPLVDYVMTDIPRYNCGGGLMTTCRIYDWIQHSPSLSDEQKRRMRDHIAATAFKCAKVQESGHAFCIFHHRGGCGWIADVLVAGLTLHGEHPDAEKLLRWGAGYFIKNYFRGWQRLGGRWSDYHVASVQMPLAVALWASAVEEPDVYEVIRQDWGDWLQGHMYYLMATRLPNRCFSGASAGGEHDQTKWLSNSDNYMLIARGYKNPDGYAYLRWMGVEPKRFSGLNVLLYDQATDAKEPWFTKDQPITWMWGRDGNGYVVMRSKGWAPDSTVIEFRCGDYFWSHAFNCNQNSFYIYHKGHLAPHTGLYAGLWRGHGHSAEYNFRTIASNSMLVFQPGEFWVCRGRAALPAAGGQRWAYPGHSSNFTFDEYLARLKGKGVYRFETGEILAFERAPDHRWSYVCGDATMAYNNPTYCEAYEGRKNRPKLDLFTRSMVYFPQVGNLVIFDRVNALDPSYRKAWLLHSVGRPQVNGRLVKAQVPGHIEDFDGDTIQATWEGGVIPPPDPKDPGRLFVRTFLPAERVIRRIGGEGYEFWANGKNREPDAYRGSLVPGTRHPIEGGKWRVEVSPAAPATFDNFLHLIHIGDTKTTAMPPAAMVTAEGERMTGVRAAGWLVLFGRKGEVAGPVTYEAPPEATEHLLVDLKRGGAYTVSGIAGGARRMSASGEGSLRFRTTAKGLVTVTPVE